MTSPLTSALSASTGSRADAGQARIDQKARSQVDAMKTLMKAQADSAEKRKEVARQKLERLKQQIAQLRLMGASPQQIAALARELSAAVKAYGGGGGMIGISTGAAASAQASAAPQADLAAQAAGDPVSNEPASDEAAGDDAQTPEEQAAKPETPYDKALRALQDDAARGARRSAEAQQDREFLGLARRLARELKAAAEAAAREDSREARKAQQAAQVADQTVSETEQALQPAGAVGLFLSV